MRGMEIDFVPNLTLAFTMSRNQWPAWVTALFVVSAITCQSERFSVAQRLREIEDHNIAFRLQEEEFMRYASWRILPVVAYKTLSNSSEGTLQWSFLYWKIDICDEEHSISTLLKHLQRPEVSDSLSMHGLRSRVIITVNNRFWTLLTKDMSEAF